MPYHHSFILLQDMIKVLGNELGDPNIRRNYAFEELEHEVVLDVAEIASIFPTNVKDHWEIVVADLEYLNSRLRLISAPLLEIPSFESFVQVVQAKTKERGAPPSDADMDAANAFLIQLMLHDDDPVAASNRVAARGKDVEARRDRVGQTVPLAALDGSRAKEILDGKVRRALTMPFCEHLVFVELLAELREELSLTIDETLETAWRKIFLERIVAADLTAVAP